MRPIHGLIGLVVLPLFACVGQTPAARAQEASSDLNTNQRFGRMELVAERVSDSARERFFARRKAWGTKIQIADSEILTFKMKGESEAEVTLKVSWYRVDEGDVRATTLKQSWKDFRGTWKLTGEDNAEGDLGLLSDAPLASVTGSGSKAKTGDAPRGGNTEGASTSAGAATSGTEPTPATPLKKSAQFATIRLGQADTQDNVPDEELQPPEVPRYDEANAPPLKQDEKAAPAPAPTAKP